MTTAVGRVSARATRQRRRRKAKETAERGVRRAGELNGKKTAVLELGHVDPKEPES
jgi:hypothetical protein